MIDDLRRTALFAALAAVAGLAGGYATAGWTAAYAVLPVDDLLIWATPAAVVNFMITNVGPSAHYLHVGGAFAIVGTILAVLAALGLVVGDRRDAPAVGALLAAALVAAVTLALPPVLWALVGDDGTALADRTVPVLTTALSVGAVVAVGTPTIGRASGASTVDGDRRRFVSTVAGVVTYSGLSLSLGSIVSSQAQETGVDLGEEAVEAQAMVEAANEGGLDIGGVGPPISQIGEFYMVDINSTPPGTDAEDWSLTIRGAVEDEVTIEYDDLRSFETDHRYLALRCIGEDLNEDKLDTAVWTGVPMTTLFDLAGPTGEYVELHSADGYVSTFSRSAIDFEDGLLAYGMNGEPLPRGHGFPARALIPGAWGKLNNKWISDIVFVEEPTEGYWEERGWESEAPITAVAKLWTGEPGDRVNRLDDGRLEVGGHAYAGARGVDRVEVSVDGGDTWNDAELSEPLSDGDVTRQWRYRYEADERHVVVARVIDGEGNVQTDDRTGSSPDGASGWVSAEIDP